ncbi:phage tail protein [Croceicoccus gelatinilyticus]|uniref:GTA baseplate fiber-binding domain-containing protein n=1 Tax=Croceicoccus gelatinilyticus TaxID=2835536 RepID=UPI001BCD855E|nr:phage tail protein [Croceicoccus gelatinilyticus]MBS7669325.1 hypothetical protein [Croceicoccus gelatinilyticus]
MAVDPVSLAVTVALTAAQMAMQASQTIEGPRVTDLNATVADYGTPFNYFYGRRWLTCPCFFAEDIEEKKKRRKTKGGKYNEYTYFGTWAIHVADHPIGQIRKIKFDGHLVYDVTASEPLYELDDDYELDANMRFYFGSADQMPDPRMLATVEAEQGEGTCPAYRHQSYIFFERIPLEKLGNRLPIVTVEAETGGGVVIDMDFYNGVYTINGEPAALTDIFEDGGDGSGLNTWYPGDVSGGAWRFRSDGSIDPGVKRTSSRAQLTDTVRDMILASDASGISGTYDFVATFVSPPGGGSEVEPVRFGHSIVSDDALESWGAEVRYTFDSDPDDLAGLWLSNPVDSLSYLPSPSMGGAYVSKKNSLSMSDGVRSLSRTQAFDFDIGEIRFELSAGLTAGLADNSTANLRHLTITTGAGGTSFTLADIMTDLSLRAGLEAGDFDYSALDDVVVDGFSWTQGSVKQIAGPLLDVYDFDVRPHDFLLEGLPRSMASQGAITDFVKAEPRWVLESTADSDLPRRVFFNFADIDSDQQTNTAVSQRRGNEVGTVRELTLDLTTLALTPTPARRYADRFLRRKWWERTRGNADLSRRHIAVEPGDVYTLSFDGEPISMKCAKLTLGANGVMQAEWESDIPSLTGLSSAAGASADGIPPAEIYAPSPTTGAVLDLPLLIDAHDQSVPFAYLAAGPTDDTRSWPGASFAQSDTGETESFAADWDTIASDLASEIGVMSDVLPDAEPFNFDDGSSVEVVLQSGELLSTTYEDMLDDGTLNLALIGDEVVQFRTATLTAPLTYQLTGFLRGRRGTEWAMGTHGADERFILLGSVQRHDLGASEIGDTDSYIVSTVGRGASEADAFAVPYTGATHKPYAPVSGIAEQSGADWQFDATRRTRVGGTTLNGQDVPLGEASEAWELDVMDGESVVRTIAAATLPITYAEADQVTDFGSAQGTVTARLYQMNPTLNLRGYPLTITG